jgi:4-amino-4-deoxy-L-arabinose transferase-like glycosyltransferase
MNPPIPILGILLALTAILRLINLTGSPARLDDEGTYVAQAYAVTQWGELAHYTYWYDHPPAGWLQLAAWTAVPGPELGGNAVVAGRYLMVVFAVVTAGLLWCLARRVGMSRWVSAVAVVIYALSPLSISLTRAVYLDGMAIAWVTAALVLICSPRHRLSAMFGAAACFGVAVLTKETMLLFVPMVLWLVWTRTVSVTRRYALAVFGTLFAMVVGTYLLMAVVCGELVPGPGTSACGRASSSSCGNVRTAVRSPTPVRSNAIRSANGCNLIRRCPCWRRRSPSPDCSSSDSGPSPSGSSLWSPSSSGPGTCPCR